MVREQVPPMPAEKARQVLQQELGVQDLSEVFEWINLDKPLGSASVSQVRRLQAGPSHLELYGQGQAHAGQQDAHGCWNPPSMRVP